jgi:hypothetical protein
MTLSQLKEKFFRDFFARQRDISKQALAAAATMAQANMEMILTSGLSTVRPKLLVEVQEDVNIQGQLETLKQEVLVNKQSIENNTQAIATSKDKEVVQEAKVRAIEKGLEETKAEVEATKEEIKLAQRSMRSITDNIA